MKRDTGFSILANALFLLSARAELVLAAELFDVGADKLVFAGSAAAVVAENIQKPG